jgi:hypothetical protein
MRRGSVSLACLLSLVACGDDAASDAADGVAEVGESGSGESTGAGEGTGDATGTSDDATNTSDASTSDDATSSSDDTTGEDTSGDGDACGSGGGPEFEPFAAADWARGDITVARVEVNQGAAIPIVLAGALIPVEERTGGLVQQRNALVQVFWAVPGNWQPRPITAKLHLRDGDGVLSVMEQTKTIAGPPSSGSLDGAFSFQIPGPAFEGNMEFYVELWEGEGGHEGLPASSAAPAAPGGGMQPFGVTCEPMEAKIVMVPVEYDHGNCHTDTTSTLQNNLDEFADHFFAQNPIHTLDISIRSETLVRDTQVTTLSQVNTMLVEARFLDFAEPNEYYFALLDACTGGIDGAGGLSPGTPGPIKGLGDLRVSTGLLAGVEWSKGTFVHELGHNQGRPHSPCGDPDGPDPNYPHANASIGVYGFHVLTGQFFATNYKDYMSYCEPTWVSDWTWGWVHEQVRQLTSWDYAGAAPGDEREILHGWVHPAGEQAWWTSPGELPADMLEVAEHVAYYDAEGALIERVPAASWLLDDGKTRYFMAEVPDSDLELVDAIVRTSADLDAAVPRHAITRYFGAGR